MVDYTAIKATSESLRKLLETGMKSLGNGKITIGRPKNENGGNNRINLFLFQVEENKHLKNNDESRLWLDLFYLLTPYDDDDTQAQAILGDAMRVFHDYPIIHPDLKLKSNGKEVEILEEVLRGAVEKIKITPYPMTLEDLSKLWNSLNGDFRLSVPYQVSVVQIDSEKEKPYHAPVRARNIDTILAGYPEIADIRPHRITIDEPLEIIGRNLYSEETKVKIGVKQCSPITNTNEKITVEIPSDLLPGPHIIEVVLKPIPEKDYLFSSNQGVIILVPMIEKVDLTDNEMIITGTKLYAPAIVKVTLNSETKEVKISGSPTNIDDARSALEAGLNSFTSDPNFRDAKVIRVESDIFILSGNRTDTFTFAPSGENPAFYELGLDSQITVQGVFCEPSLPFSLNKTEKIEIAIGGESEEIEIDSGNYNDIDSVQKALEKGVNALSSEKLKSIKVVIDDDQLLFLPGETGESIEFIDNGGKAFNKLGLKNTTDVQGILCNLSGFSGVTEMIPTLHIGNQSTEFDELIDETEVRIHNGTLNKILIKLEEGLYLIRVRVNGLENRGEPVGDDKNEWMWFYNKTEPPEIIKKRFPEDVLKHE